MLMWQLFCFLAKMKMDFDSIILDFELLKWEIAVEDFSYRFSGFGAEMTRNSMNFLQKK